MTRKQIRTNINAGKYRAKYPDNLPCIPPKNCVIDANMTVKWNHEQIALRKKTRDNMLAEYREQDNAAQAQFATDCCAYIQSEISVSGKQARILFNYAYEHGHACGFFDILSEVDEIISLTKDFLEAAHED